MELVLTFLFNPAVFISILAVIFVCSAFVLLSWSRQTTRQIKEKDDALAKLRVSSRPEPREPDAGKETAYKERILLLERDLKASEEKRLTLTEADARHKSDNAALRKSIEDLQVRLRDREELARELTVVKNENDALKKAVEKMKNAAPPSAAPAPAAVLSPAAAAAAPGVKSEGLIEKNNVLHEQVAKMTQELALKNQLYDGLKAQYGELEKSLEGVLQQLEKEKKAQQLLSQRLWEITKTHE